MPAHPARARHAPMRHRQWRQRRPLRRLLGQYVAAGRRGADCRRIRGCARTRRRFPRGGHPLRLQKHRNLSGTVPAIAAATMAAVCTQFDPHTGARRRRRRSRVTTHCGRGGRERQRQRPRRRLRACAAAALASRCALCQE
eukprot:254339-Chlamydomonas_euryale.AAC.1